MMQENSHRSLGWLSFLVIPSFVVCVPGCGSKEIPPLPQEQIHIMKIAALWGDYRRDHKGQAPASTKDFTDWAKKLKPDQLSKHGITDLNEALTSPRDGQPYEIAPVSSNARGGMSRVVIYEKQGVNGKHMTASSMGSSADMAHDELAKIVPKL